MTTRDISTLLKCDTFQDMSDEEIMLVIDFWKEDKYNDGYYAGYNDCRAELGEKNNIAIQTVYSNMVQALNNANFTPKLISYDGGEV